MLFIYKDSIVIHNKNLPSCNLLGNRHRGGRIVGGVDPDSLRWGSVYELFSRMYTSGLEYKIL